VEIAEILLKAGADVNAVGEMYRGSTTLGLVATSIHPLLAGVQEALIDLLLEHGASFDGAVAPDYTAGSIVNACLANGRGRAAAYLAKRGARLDLEGAAGVGQVDVVKSFFNEDGSLKANATKEEMKSGFNWACEYGWLRVVDFLLQRGINVGERHRGETGLHWAAHGAHVEIVKLLLERKAPVDVEDERWSGTPLEWALHGWLNPSPETMSDGYYHVVALLVAAGSIVEPEWLASEKVRADPRMLAALATKMSR
jgi:ankyrin repeat protein